MNKKYCPAIVVGTFFAICCHSGLAQMAGSRADRLSIGSDELPRLTIDTVNSHITIEGSAQQRVAPTSMRLIWAVATEANQGGRCQELGSMKTADPNPTQSPEGDIFLPVA